MTSGDPDRAIPPDHTIQAALDDAERQIEAAWSFRRNDVTRMEATAAAIRAGLTSLRPLPPGPERRRRALVARTHSLLAVGRERVSDYPAAIRLANEALNALNDVRAAEPDDVPHLALFISEALKTIGNSYKNLGEYAEALRVYEEDLRLAEGAAAAVESGHAFNNIGNVCYHLGDYARAVESYLAALDLFVANDWPRGQAASLNGLANVYFNQDDYPRALESYERALAIFESMEEPYWVAGLLGNAANACVRLGDFDRALDMHQRSLAARREIGDRQGQAHSYYNLGEFHAARGNCRDALRAHRRAVRIFDAIDDKNGLAGAHVALGRLYASCGRDRRALLHLSGGLFLADQGGMRDLAYTAHEVLSGVYERAGDGTRALEHFRQFHAIKETIFNEESDRRVRNLQVLHEAEQARRATEIYRRHNAELEAANAALREADAFKSELLARLRRQSDALERQARTDSLTGLLNRRAANKRLNEEFTRARRQQQPLSIVICDIDNFKRINDTFSHQVGDRVLRTVARLLRRSLRRSDVSARYGGEEFVLVLPGAPLLAAVTVCENLRERVAAHPWAEIHPDLSLTVSIGVSSLASAPEAENYEHLLAIADHHLYEAKRAGRNLVRHPAPADDEEARKERVRPRR